MRHPRLIESVFDPLRKIVLVGRHLCIRYLLSGGRKRMKQRLTAIFAMDMVGYSRLMEADEMGTIVRHKKHRAQLIDPAIFQ